MLVSLLVLLLTGQAGVQGYVWCLGEDGHAALEYAASTACRPDAQPQDHDGHGEDPRDLSDRDDHCGPCLDLPASFEATSRRSQNHKNFAAQIGSPATALPSPIPAFTPLIAAPLVPRPPPGLPQTILFHRTVVLLI